LSSILSYPNLTICSHFCAICSRIEPTIAFELRWVLIGIAITIVAACLILAARILTREEKAASQPRAQKISLLEAMPIKAAEKIATPEETREPAEILASEEATEEISLLEAMPVKAAEKTATPEETREPAEILASEEATEEKVLLTLPQTTTAQSITEAKEVVLSEARLQVEEQSQKKKPGETLSRPSQKTALLLGITELKIVPAEARPGETVTISFNVTNVNDVPGYYSVTLRINDVVMATKGVSLVRRSAMHMAFTVVETLPGDYKVDVNGVAGRLTIFQEIQVCTCHTCGRKVAGGYKFCGSCGTPLKREDCLTSS